MSDLMGSQQAVMPGCCPAVLRKLAKGAYNDWTLAASNIVVVLIHDGWWQRATVINATGADGHKNYYKHYDNIPSNNTSVMPIILTLYSRKMQSCMLSIFAHIYLTPSIIW